MLWFVRGARAVDTAENRASWPFPSERPRRRAAIGAALITGTRRSPRWAASAAAHRSCHIASARAAGPTAIAATPPRSS